MHSGCVKILFFCFMHDKHPLPEEILRQSTDLGGLMIGGAAKAKDIFNETGDRFVGALSPCLQKAFCSLSSLQVREYLFQAGDRGVPRRK